MRVHGPKVHVHVYDVCTQAPKEWYFYPKGYNPEQQTGSTAASATAEQLANSSNGEQYDGDHNFYQVGDEKVPGVDESGRAGPISKEALKQLHSKGVTTHDTWVWAAGMPEPQQLRDVRELRWMLATGLGLLGPFEAALVALQVILKF